MTKPRGNLPWARLQSSSVIVHRRPCSRNVALKHTFALRFLPRQLARTAHGFGLFARALDRRLLEMLPKLRFTEHAFALHLLLERPKRLIDIVVANLYLHWFSPPFLSVSFEIPQERAI